jgi:DNA repair exonuclease SbcCD ATPase subunit
MILEFNKIAIRNFLSYKEESLDFNGKGITLLSGKNGDGKSVIGSALFYALFGKSDRKMKLEKMINTNQGNKLYVKLDFSINDDKYSIERGMKPSIFKIYKNDIMIDIPANNKDYQKILEDIVQFDELAFNQLLYLGANVTDSKNFMELNAKEKEKIFQVLLDTSIFSEVEENSRDYLRHIKNQLEQTEYKSSIVDSDICTLESENIKAIKQKSEIIDNKKSLIESAENDILSIQSQIDDLLEKFKLKEKVQNEVDTISGELIPLREKSKQIINILQDDILKIRQYQQAENDKIICDNCQNEIKQHFDFNYDEIVSNAKILKIDKEKIQEKIQNLENVLTEKNSIVNKFNLVQQKISSLKSSIVSQNNRIKDIESMKEIEIDTKLLEKKKREKIKLKKEVLNLKKKSDTIKELLILISEENIKGELIDEQIPHLNFYINKYLEELGLSFNFILDKYFQEKIISVNDELAFNGLSNGQKMRIIIAILFAFLKISELKGKVSFNLLILDEFINGSLDSDGVDSILKLLTVISKGKEVILITHNNEIKNQEIFSRQLSITRDIFSKINYL